jgi:hypothetical protein
VSVLDPTPNGKTLTVMASTATTTASTMTGMRGIRRSSAK